MTTNDDPAPNDPELERALALPESAPSLLSEQHAAILLEARRAAERPARRRIVTVFKRIAAALLVAVGLSFAVSILAGGGGAGPESVVALTTDPQARRYAAELKAAEEALTQVTRAVGYADRSSEALTLFGDADGAEHASLAPVKDIGFARAAVERLSTFGADVDTASYAILRRMLNEGRLPPPAWVRVEELVNYFPYAYEGPTGPEPFAVRMEAAACPWNLAHRLVRVAIKGREVAKAERPRMNLVFLVDVSGSMSSADKLPLVQSSLRMLLDELTDWDHVAIVTYAGDAGVRLTSTSCRERATIRAAIDGLSSGGSTAGAAGIEAAYAEAAKSFVPGGVNRVVLATDGDFNVGVTNHAELLKLVEEKAKSGVFLSVLGYGMGNLKDDTLELLADKGNGNYAYVDTEAEARKTLVENLGATLQTIAKDVKIQVEFNPSRVSSWRLVGYENRLMPARDFRDDTKDGGEVGAGHAVTAFYEIVPVGAEAEAEEPPLRYGPREVAGGGSGETLAVSVRWKSPEAATSQEIQTPLVDGGARYEQASADFKFAASVAMFGMLLRDSTYKGTATYEGVSELASEGLANDPGGYRREFVALVGKAKALVLQSKNPPAAPPTAAIPPAPATARPAPAAPSTPASTPAAPSRPPCGPAGAEGDCAPNPDHPARIVFEGLGADGALDLGDLKQGVEIERTVSIRNAGECDLCIQKVETGCGCVKVALSGAPRVGPDAATTLTVRVNTAGREGTVVKEVIVHSNDPKRPEARFQVRLAVRLGVVTSAVNVWFGRHAVGKPGYGTIRLKSPVADADWTVTAVEGTKGPYSFTVTPVESSDPSYRALELKIRHPGLATPDTFIDTLKIRTSHPERPEIVLSGQMIATRKYYTGPAERVSFGFVGSGAVPIQRQVYVWPGEDGTEFRLKRVAVEGGGYEASEAKPSTNNGWVVDVRYDGKSRANGSTVEATLVLEVDDPEAEPLRVRLSGVVRESK